MRVEQEHGTINNQLLEEDLWGGGYMSNEGCRETPITTDCIFDFLSNLDSIFSEGWGV